MALLFDEGLGLVVGTNDKPRGNWGFITAIIIGLLFWLLCIGLVRTANAQETRDTSRTWYITADTAGIDTYVTVEDSAGVPIVVRHADQYITHVSAAASPTAFPSSVIVVVWDCANRKVKRLSQTKYVLNADSTIVGQSEAVDRPWQDVVDERLYNLVCSIGPVHAVLWEETPEAKLYTPPQPQPWLAPGKPRSDT